MEEERIVENIAGKEMTVIIRHTSGVADDGFTDEHISETLIEDKPDRRRKADKEEKPVSATREIMSMLMYVAIVLVTTFLIVHYVGQRTQVKGHSMEDTLNDKDNLIVDKISYRFKDPQRFDIIVFPHLGKEDTYYIKRIIGLPGETIQIVDGSIFIDGNILDEDYGKEVMLTSGVAEETLLLSDDEYFVLGDNRNNSADSRDPNVGNVKRENIMGRAWLRIWPLSEFGILEHQ